jgi:CheY-like chemotaxis protein
MTESSICQVLIVEDDPPMRVLLADLLTEAGYIVATMANGATALDSLRHAPTPPQLILLDLMMPVMDGWHFRTLQCADPDLAAIPTIVLSAHVESRAAETRFKHVRGMSADAYLPKPIDAEQLLTLVAQYCTQ